jgi:hypothetical protein
VDGISGTRILRSIKRLRSQAFSSRRRLTSATDASRFGNSLLVLLKSKPYPDAPLLDFKMIAHCRAPSCAGGEAGCCSGRLPGLIVSSQRASKPQLAFYVGETPARYGAERLGNLAARRPDLGSLQ